MATGHEVERYRLGAKQVDHSLLAPAPIGISGFEAAEVNTPEYDLVVIGSGPAGQKGAIAAAKARKSVAVIDRIGMIGGVSVHTGTIPSKTVREAIFQLSGLAVSALYGAGSRGRVDISVENVSSRVKAIVARETGVVRAQLERNGIVVHPGCASFLDPHTLEVQGGDGEGIRLKGRKILIACGTRPAHSPDIPFDNHRIVDTDHLGDLGGLPKEIIVVGAGVVGLEYASFMTALGAEVTLIDQRPVVLDFVDRQIVEALSYHLRQQGVTFRLAEKVTRVGIDPARESCFCSSWRVARKYKATPSFMLSAARPMAINSIWKLPA